MKARALDLLLVAVVLWVLLSFTTASLNPIQSIENLLKEADDLMTATKLTKATFQDDGTTVAESPETLASQAGETIGQAVGVEEYALARMLRNERTTAARGGNEAEGAALVWVAINDANAHNSGNILKCLTGGHGFGKQGSLRKYATGRSDPYDVDLDLVRRCLAGTIQDPTGGCTHFLHRGGFKTTQAYEEVVAKWTGYGWSRIDADFGTTLEVWT